MEIMGSEKKDKNLDTTYTDANNKLQDQRSTQENKQDLDQQQQVDVKPSQINIQKIDLTVNTKLENYSGKITGVIYKSRENVFVAKAEVLLYFGVISDFPVYKTISDENGCYSIEDLPPGFYSIKATYRNYFRITIHNIKVLPGQTSNQPLYFTRGISS